MHATGDFAAMVWLHPLLWSIGNNFATPTRARSAPLVGLHWVIIDRLLGSAYILIFGIWSCFKMSQGSIGDWALYTTKVGVSSA